VEKTVQVDHRIERVLNAARQAGPLDFHSMRFQAADALHVLHDQHVPAAMPGKRLRHGYEGMAGEVVADLSLAFCLDPHVDLCEQERLDLGEMRGQIPLPKRSA
jgi:hypothetical protein